MARPWAPAPLTGPPCVYEKKLDLPANAKLQDNPSTTKPIRTMVLVVAVRMGPSRKYPKRKQ